MSNQHTIGDISFQILRAHGIKIIFGNPGSNELPFLAQMPSDFDFVLGLQEQTVMGMADGYAQGSLQPVLVNLHAASGTGNAMGALTNAYYAHSPLVILAGQQVRQTVGQETMLASVDTALLPRPLVKYSHEPLSAIDVSRTLSQAILEATIAPTGPVYISVPLDDWEQPAQGNDQLLVARRVDAPGQLSQTLVGQIASALDGYQKSALVLGPQMDRAAFEAPSVFKSIIRLAEKLDACVFIAPSPSRCPFPTTHPNFAGVLTPSIEATRARLADHDGVMVIGAPVMRYHRWEPGNYINEGTEVWHITEDPAEAARAPFGRAVVAAIGDTVDILAEQVADRAQQRQPRTLPTALSDSTKLTSEQILEVFNEQVHGQVIYVNETTSLDLKFLERVAIDRPGMYYFPASGGLGFGLAAAVGLALARPKATVVATIGDGAANYSLAALYTAAQRNTRTIFIIVNNSGYGALKNFAEHMDVPEIPGLELSNIDFKSLAAGYGVPAQQVESRAQFASAYQQALACQGPVLIDAHVID